MPFSGCLQNRTEFFVPARCLGCRQIRGLRTCILLKRNPVLGGAHRRHRVVFPRHRSQVGGAELPHRVTQSGAAGGRGALAPRWVSGKAPGTPAGWGGGGPRIWAPHTARWGAARHRHTRLPDETARPLPGALNSVSERKHQHHPRLQLLGTDTSRITVYTTNTACWEACWPSVPTGPEPACRPRSARSHVCARRGPP